MFFFIGGVQSKTVRLEKQSHACPVCSHFEVYCKRVDHYIALFFIPLFPIKKGPSFLICENCNTVLDESDSYGYGAGDRGKPQRCGFCGKSLETGFAYCPYCGRPV
jgi:hypothetical protein